jgi:hypothetical protein
LTATNPLNAPLVLSNLTVITSSDDLAVETIPELILDPYQTRTVSINIAAHQATRIEVLSASFLFHRFLPCTQSLARKGKRLQITKAHKVEPTYGKDTSLTVEIERGGATFEVTLEGAGHMFDGEEVEGVLRIRNGKVAVEGLRLLTSDMGMIRLKGKEGM